VVAVAKGPAVLLEELVVGEGLAGDLRLGDAEEDDDRPAQRGRVVPKVRRQPARHLRRSEAAREGDGDRADDLPGRHLAAAQVYSIRAVGQALHPPDRTADPEDAAQLTVVG